LQDLVSEYQQYQEASLDDEYGEEDLVGEEDVVDVCVFDICFNPRRVYTDEGRLSRKNNELPNDG
jgi:hypothetical protein